MSLVDWLEDQGADLELITHEPTYSAQRLAEAMHVSGDNVAKAVLLRVDRHYVVAVLPATYQLHFEMVRDALHAQRVALADANELALVFPDCESGIVPPFGSQYSLTTLVDYALTEDDEIVFEVDAHRLSVRMRYRQFELIERPKVASIAYHECPTNGRHSIGQHATGSRAAV
jgi:Ala-tRNA(Pro) deacylase